MRLAIAVLALAGSLVWIGAARADAPTLTVSLGDKTQVYTAAELLARPDAATIAIPADVAYGGPMTFRAVPLLALVPAASGPALDTIEARASDGFVSQLPRALVDKGASGGSVAWVAVEDPAAPWPNLPGKQASAGPFYLVWEHPERSGIGSEQWPYQTIALTGVELPAHRWPQMAVDASLPADAPAQARAGGVHGPVPAVPPHEGRRRGRARARPRPAHEPDAVFYARGPAQADPQPEVGAHVAGPDHAGLRSVQNLRRRPRRCHRLSRRHGTGTTVRSYLVEP